MTILVFVELLAASIWIGGFVAIGVVAKVARAQLEPAQRVAFFRHLGRTYLRVGGAASRLRSYAAESFLPAGRGRAPSRRPSFSAFALRPSPSLESCRLGP